MAASKLVPLEIKVSSMIHNDSRCSSYHRCYDIMPVRKEEGKSYWKIPFCDDDATREK